MSRDEKWTPTSYAVLGLLTAGPQSAYSVTQKMQLRFDRFYARPPSVVYQELENLAAAGLVTAHEDAVGKRPRTVYAVTDRGIDALTEWVTTPSPLATEWDDGFAWQVPPLLKVFFWRATDDAAARSALSSNVGWVRAWARVQETEAHRRSLRWTNAAARSGATGSGGLLVDCLLIGLCQAVATWASWVLSVIDGTTGQQRYANPDWAEFERIVGRVFRTENSFAAWEAELRRRPPNHPSHQFPDDDYASAPDQRSTGV